jgi:hypothetical protein
MPVPDENPPQEDLSIEPSTSLDPQFGMEVERLYRVMLYGRWLVAGLLWLTVGGLSLWDLRGTIALMQQYFTWSALRYGLLFHPFGAIGLGLCIGMTVSVLIWQSRNILWGLPPSEQKRLQQAVCKIRQQGSSHPLWKWVCWEPSRSLEN